MPVSDLDIWRTANVMIKQHGEDAAFHAAQRADALLAAGDMEGEAVFDAEQVKGFGAAFVNSPRVDAALFECVGHCIDFHRLGSAFQLEQLAFALRCCIQHRD